VEFAEPDFQQRWVTGREADNALALASDCSAPANPNAKFPFPDAPDPLWFQSDAYGQFAGALTVIGIPPAENAVRIAHLDTGYDPNHSSLPERLETIDDKNAGLRNLQRNFVDADRSNDASDDTEGPLTNLGHGTGTLSILAGKYQFGPRAMGAAPFARIVPIRVANRVVLFHNSTIAQAFAYVRDLCANPATRVDIVTMSMGGLASQIWAEAVNELYEAGVFVVTAAGNNIGNLPTRNIVYPARFNRVVAACGVMFGNKPYADLPFPEMAGNYGPSSKMRTALSAYTPNVPWAKLGCPEIVDLDGAGTSAATPQVTAAAAIWIQKYRARLEQYPERWMRVEAVRKALFGRSNAGDETHLGKGELRARSALDEPPANTGLQLEKRDSASFALFRVLTGFGVAAPDGRQQMLELEALQLSQSRSRWSRRPQPMPAMSWSKARAACWRSGHRSSGRNTSQQSAG
jgi:subtilisin family serine protease